MTTEELWNSLGSPLCSGMVITGVYKKHPEVEVTGHVVDFDGGQPCIYLSRNPHKRTAKRAHIYDAVPVWTHPATLGGLQNLLKQAIIKRSDEDSLAGHISVDEMTDAHSLLQALEYVIKEGQ